jgi:hypothetical protein
MARLACEQLGADWIIHSDADEFWIPRDAASLAEFFQGIEGHNVVRAKRHDFVCLQEDNDDNAVTPFWERMTYRKKTSLNSLGRPLPPKVAHRASAEIVVAQGNHSVSGLADKKTLQQGIEILHFRLRSRRQYLNKISVGGRVYESNDELPTSAGSTWRRQYRELLETGTLKFVEENLVSSDRLGEMIAAGEVVEDLRLREAMRGMQR